MPYEDFDGTAEDILKRLIASMPTPGSPHHEQMKIAIQVRSINGLVDSLDALHQSVIKSTESSDKLSAKVFWLTSLLLAQLWLVSLFLFSVISTNRLINRTSCIIVGSFI